MTTCKHWIAGFALLAALGIAPTAEACSARLVKIVVPNPPGGSSDLIARAMGEKVGAVLGQSVVIENRAGASTVIGADFVAKSKPDGCTILSLTTAGVVVSVLRDKMPYDLQRDFVPIVSVGSFPMVLAVSPDSKLSSLADVATAAKAANGITYVSGGTGTMAHLAAARLIRELGGTGTHVPYRGNGEAIQALLGNHAQMLFPSTADAGPLITSGKIRILAVTSDNRLPTLPNVPTMKELGYADFTPRLWYAFVAPANTPAESISRLHDAFASAAKDPGIEQRLRVLGFTSEIKDSAALSAYVKAEADRWSKVIKENNVKSSD